MQLNTDNNFFTIDEIDKFYLDLDHNISSHPFSKFEKHLLLMDKRFRLYDICDREFDEYKKHYYIPTKEYIILSYTIPNIAHEISHFVEMNNFDRLIKPDFGFDPIGSNKYKSPKNIVQAISRENRVVAIESIIKNIDYSIPIKENDYWFETFKNILPFGKFKTIENVFDWSEFIYISTKNKWSKDRIEHEWKIRLNYVQNWMETN